MYRIGLKLDLILIPLEGQNFYLLQKVWSALG